MSNAMPPPPPPNSMPPPPGAYGVSPMSSPRPDVKMGALVALGGALLIVVGSFLTWFTVDLGFDSESFNGFSDAQEGTKDGPVFVFLALVVGGLALAMFFAGRVLAVAIVAVVFAAFTLLVVFVDVSDVSDAKDVFGDTLGWGPGLWVALVGSLLALAGSIMALAKRRR